jgi:hypothetical protein
MVVLFVAKSKIQLAQKHKSRPRTPSGVYMACANCYRCAGISGGMMAGDSHVRAAEMHELAAHAHRAAAAHHGKEDHQTGHEHAQQAMEHAARAFRASQEALEQSAMFAKHGKKT